MSLSDQQTELLRALVAGGAPPAGFDPGRLAATARVLLHKRAGDVARAWPALAQGLGPAWHPTFSDWARERPKTTSFADGYTLAEHLIATGGLPASAGRELARARLDWRRDAHGTLHARRGILRMAKAAGTRAISAGPSGHRRVYLTRRS